MVLSSDKKALFQRALNQGHSAAWEGRWQQAIVHYTEALNEFPESLDVLNSLALANYELNHLDEALDLYQRASRISPDDPLPIEKSSQIYKLHGQIDKAAEMSMKAADLYLNMRDTDKAIHNWTRVISLQPENIDAHISLANIYERLGRIELAISEHISVASLLQFEGKLEEAKARGEHALSINPQSKEAIQVVELLNNFKSLPKPNQKSGDTGPLRLPEEILSRISKTQSLPIEDGPDPIEEATQLAIQQLAGMLFDLGPMLEKANQQGGALRNFARVVTGGLLSKNYNERKITQALSKTIDFQRQEDFVKAAESLKAAIDAGLDHPSAHFDLAYLLSQIDRRESAQRSYHRAVQHVDFALAARLQIADFLQDQKKNKEASIEFMNALQVADAIIVGEKHEELIRAQYDPIIESISQIKDEKAIENLNKNIRHLLMRPNWRFSVQEARAQLPKSGKGNGLLPLADILTQNDSGKLLDAMEKVNRIANAGYPRAAIEESFYTMDYAANYLPLHINMGEIMLLQGRSKEAIEKFSVIAKLYNARGESDRATHMYQRIVDVSPLNTEARQHLITEVTLSGDIEGAISQYLEMADVYYRLAQLNEARDTYEKALKMVQSTSFEATWTAQILHKMADIDLQKLNWRKALRVYEQLRTLVPGDISARLKLVQLNLGLGQNEKADGEMDSYLAYLNSLSHDDLVGTFLQKVTEENGDYSAGRRRLAEYYQQSGDQDKAIKEWNRVGELLVESGDREGAKVAVRAILSMNPPNAERYREFLKQIR